MGNKASKSSSKNSKNINFDPSYAAMYPDEAARSHAAMYSSVPTSVPPPPALSPEQMHQDTQQSLGWKDASKGEVFAARRNRDQAMWQQHQNLNNVNRMNRPVATGAIGGGAMVGFGGI